MLAGVADCRRSQKWVCKGRWALGFKPRPGSHRRKRPRGSIRVGRTKRFWGRKGETTRLQSSGEDHKVLGEKKRPCGSEGKERDHEASKSREDHKVMGEKEETMQL